jgi:hypothetical protein
MDVITKVNIGIIVVCLVGPIIKGFFEDRFDI